MVYFTRFGVAGQALKTPCTSCFGWLYRKRTVRYLSDLYWLAWKNWHTSNQSCSESAASLQCFAENSAFNKYDSTKSTVSYSQSYRIGFHYKLIAMCFVGSTRAGQTILVEKSRAVYSHRYNRLEVNKVAIWLVLHAVVSFMDTVQIAIRIYKMICSRVNIVWLIVLTWQNCS